MSLRNVSVLILVSCFLYSVTKLTTSVLAHRPGLAMAALVSLITHKLDTGMLTSLGGGGEAEKP